MGEVLELSFLILVLGAKGFTKDGLPFSSKTSLTGARGRAVGAMVIVLGLGGVAFAYWASAPAERARVKTLGQGILCGLMGGFLVFGEAMFRANADDAPQVHDAEGDGESETDR
jgi:hypothetical protein